MTEGGEPIVELGTQDAQGAFTGEFEFDYATDTGDALLRHVDSGAELRWSVANSRWELNEPLDLGSNALTNLSTIGGHTLTGNVDFDGNNATNVGEIDVGEIGNGGSPVTLTDLLDRDLSRGSLTTILEILFSVDNEFVKVETINRTIPSDAAVQIASLNRGMFTIVLGEEVGDGTTRFLDVITGLFDSQTVQFSEESSSTPDGRSYTSATNMFEAQMDGTTDYEASVFSVRLRGNA